MNNLVKLKDDSFIRSRGHDGRGAVAQAAAAGRRRATTRSRRWGRARSVAARTSSWVVGAPQRLVITESAATPSPWARAAITSGTVDMPTASAPQERNIATSARVSYEGPGTATYTPSRSG